MTEIVFATNNQHKLDEVRAMLKASFKVLSLKDIGCHDEIPETADTFKGNALLKAQYVNERYKIDCFADDSGLEIDALDGAPGVFSARFSGEEQNHEKNIEKVLRLLGDNSHRTARFRSVIALIRDGETFYFEGKVEGNILLKPRGEGGFGYDPIFAPQGYNESFAEFLPQQKNKISHRGEAIGKLASFLLCKQASS